MHVTDIRLGYQRRRMQIDIGDRIWRCIAGYGHSPEHIALHNERDGLLISGDMLLPSISTNVSVYEMEPEGDPLGLFLASITQMLDLPVELEEGLRAYCDERGLANLDAIIGKVKTHA